MSADPADPALQAEKHRLRAAARQARASAAAASGCGGTVAADALCDRFLAAVPLPPGAVVSGYWPLGDEIDPRPLMAALAGRGHPLALPASRAACQPLDFRTWRPGDALRPAGFGTQEPLAEAPMVQPEVLLVPLLAFDAAGYRLGYGGGFYDRSLALARRAGDILAVGLAFAAQQVAAVPREATDQRLDLVATERGLITPAAAEAEGP
ncbi:MAG: 5-formyltetrahydrofolate cyclo-ligase [Kiloniellaceae bacterium]